MTRLQVLEQLFIYIYRDADNLMNSLREADIDLIIDLYDKQIVEVTRGANLKSLHVSCKNVQLTLDEKIVQVLGGELIDVELVLCRF